MGRAPVRRHVFRVDRLAHDPRGDRIDLSRHHCVRGGPRQIQGRRRGSERLVLALCGPGVDVHLPAGLPDVGEDLGGLMSAHTEELAVAGGTTKTFLYVWFALLFMTGIEVFLAYEQIPVLIFLTALVGLSVIKAALIIAYFMHLKFEKLSLFITLFPMLVLCIILMLILFMPDSNRLMMTRPR